MFFVLIIIYILSMAVHEVAHGYVAYLLGDDTAKLQNRLSLNPLRHIDPFLTVILPLAMALSGGPIIGGAKPVLINTRKLKYDEWGMALVAIAGPASNFILGVALFALASLSNDVKLAEVLVVASVLNFGLMLFNLIPIPPLDGSRILYPFAPDFFQGIMNKIEERFSLLVIFVIIFLFNDIVFRYISSSIDFILNLLSKIFGV